MARERWQNAENSWKKNTIYFEHPAVFESWQYSFKASFTYAENADAFAQSDVYYADVCSYYILICDRFLNANMATVIIPYIRGSCSGRQKRRHRLVDEGIELGYIRIICM